MVRIVWESEDVPESFDSADDLHISPYCFMPLQTYLYIFNWNSGDLYIKIRTHEKQIWISLTMTPIYFVKLWRFQQKQIETS